MSLNWQLAHAVSGYFLWRVLDSVETFELEIKMITMHELLYKIGVNLGSFRTWQHLIVSNYLHLITNSLMFCISGTSLPSSCLTCCIAIAAGIRTSKVYVHVGSN